METLLELLMTKIFSKDALKSILNTESVENILKTYKVRYFLPADDFNFAL